VYLFDASDEFENAATQTQAAPANTSLTVSAYSFSSTSFIIMASIGTINADRSAVNIVGGDQTNYNIYPPPVAG
jgi:hypothetical protein